MAASRTWLQNGCKPCVQKANPSMPSTTKMQSLTIAPCF
jgi:hypothetical protein